MILLQAQMLVERYCHGCLFRRRNQKKKFGRFKPKKISNPKRPFRKFKFKKKRNRPRNKNCCFICKQEGHCARKCPNSSSSKLKSYFEIEEFKVDWSIVCSEDDVSDVYILTDASEEENNEIVQKMNICKYCSEDESFEEEEELHYSDEYEDSERKVTEETKDSLEEGTASEVLEQTPKDKCKQSLTPLPELNYFCPYKKDIVASTALVVLEYDRIEEQNLLKKIVKTNSLIYIPVEVQVKGD